MTPTIEQIKKILAGAEKYGRYADNYDHDTGQYLPNGTESQLSDLRTIIAQHEEIERLRAKIAEFEQELKISERNNRLCLRKIEQLKENTNE